MSAPVEWLTRLERSAAALAKRAGEADFEELAQFVEEREEIVSRLRQLDLPPETREVCREIVGRMLQYDPPILARMEQLKNEAAERLGKISSARKQKALYEKAVAVDSLFFDKKK